MAAVSGGFGLAGLSVARTAVSNTGLRELISANLGLRSINVVKTKATRALLAPAVAPEHAGGAAAGKSPAAARAAELPASPRSLHLFGL